ncbi:hypothetical protein [Amphritea sp.]|uniref:hypothetical protein n=1 Tax=Amphritea sp. TaxID=1872502 RepID=UPI003A8E173B
MKELVLNTISTLHYEMLAQAFSSQGLTVVERDNKRSRTKELVFYCSPEAYLLASKLSVAEPKSDDELLAEWQEQTEEQMDYVLSNSKECYLIDFDYALSDQDSFIQFLKCSVDIEISDFSALVTDKPALVEQCLLLIDDDIQQETYEDIISAADFYKKTEDSTPKARLHALIGELQQQNEDVLLKNKEHIAVSHLLQEENAKLHEELETSVERITELDRDKIALLAENEALLSQYESLKNQYDQQEKDNAKLQALHQQLESNTELSLLQIAQLQEELEASFINNTELKGVNERVLAKKAALLSQYESLKEQHAQQQTEIKKLNELRQQLKDDNELGLLQIAQLQKELEAGFINNTELKGANERALAEKATLLSQYESLKEQHAQQQTEIKKLHDLQQQLESDNELGLLQITQLQEELEISFVSNKGLEEQNKALLSEKEKLETQLHQQKENNSRLDKELKTIASNNADLKGINEIALSEKASLLSQYESLKKQYDQQQANNTKLQILQQQLESDTELQIKQLEKELEAYVTKDSEVRASNKELVIEKEQIKAALDQKQDELTQLYNKYAALETDNELGLLQIAQLQEELEFYYMKLQGGGTAKFKEKSAEPHLFVIQQSLQLAQHLKNRCA